MPRFGVCVPPAKADVLQQAGWDFAEGNVQRDLQGEQPDADWSARDALLQAALPMPAANSLLPGHLPIVGPQVDADALAIYMERVFARASAVGMGVLVLGSGGARKVPDGWDRAKARQQILDFVALCLPMAESHNVTLVLESLRQAECNICTSHAETLEYVREVDHPRFRMLWDSYHFWTEAEPLGHLEAALPYLAHVHVADRDGRTAPGVSGSSDYVPCFRLLKQADYDGCISVEAPKFDPAAEGVEASRGVLTYLKYCWQSA